MLHPVFMTSTYSRVFDVSYDPITGSRVLVQGKLIKEYLHVEPRKMLVIEDQVKPQLYFHRPIHEILGTFFKEGFVLDALEEPNFTEADVNDKRMESTCNFSQLPAIFTFRLRRAT
ncbi:hypothetical protein K4F52_003211 [Lecanicillium sp. MT-2017a]|nr:hypothetical protein K4F52_003211 [Lecanicillium sp. MT-2017a]